MSGSCRTYFSSSSEKLFPGVIYRSLRMTIRERVGRGLPVCRKMVPLTWPLFLYYSTNPLTTRVRDLTLITILQVYSGIRWSISSPNTFSPLFTSKSSSGRVSSGSHRGLGRPPLQRSRFYVLTLFVWVVTCLTIQRTGLLTPDDTTFSGSPLTILT